MDALGALSWLVEAGIDTVVADTPASWLRAPDSTSEAPALSRPPTPSASEAGPPAFSAPLQTAALIMEGDAGAAVLLALDADPRAESGRILAAREQLLLQRMMAAIGIDLEQTARIGLSGGIEPAVGEAHRVALLLGEGPCRALLGKPVAAARGEVHRIGSLSAVVTFAPAFLVSQPRMKAHAWADLRLFARSLANAPIQ